MPDRPERDLNRYIVRFPEGMRDRIAEAAKANGRSMNAEIVHRLERSFGAADLGNDLADVVSALDQVQRWLIDHMRELQPERALPVPPEAAAAGMKGTTLGRLDAPPKAPAKTPKRRRKT